MRRSRWLLVILLVLIALGAGWLWWVRPRPIDMAAHAPAGSLFYLEANNPSEIVKALERTEAWKLLDNLTGTAQSVPQNDWLAGFVRLTGIGPIESVILARSQVAIVVTNLGTTEDSETLRVRPEGALIIETKTSERRIRPVVENAVQKLAEVTYGKPVRRSLTIDGVECTEWVAPDGSRQILVVITGSLVIIGNTRQALQDCLAVRQSRRPSLKDDAELNRVRSELGAADALSFGYVPAASSPRLLATSVPLLMGRAPANSEFQRLIANGASKVIGSIGWTSRSFSTGMEDRFLISLQPAIIARLQPHFSPMKLSSQMQATLANDVQSVTYYKFENPRNTWQGLKQSVSSQMDALSSIVFTSLLNSALGSYGIDDPEAFLAAVNSEAVTLRSSQDTERSLLIARVADKARLRELLLKTMRAKLAPDQSRPFELFEDLQGQFAGSFVGEFIVFGSPPEVRKHSERLAISGVQVNSATLEKLTRFVPFTSSANIVTYADDSDRVRRFISAVLAAKRLAPVAGHRMDQALSGLPFSATETTLRERGLERTTLSPLGQFSTLLPLLIPTEPASATPEP